MMSEQRIPRRHGKHGAEDGARKIRRRRLRAHTPTDSKKKRKACFFYVDCFDSFQNDQKTNKALPDEDDDLSHGVLGRPRLQRG